MADELNDMLPMLAENGDENDDGEEGRASALDLSAIFGEDFYSALEAAAEHINLQ